MSRIGKYIDTGRFLVAWSRERGGRECWVGDGDSLLKGAGYLFGVMNIF